MTAPGTGKAPISGRVLKDRSTVRAQQLVDMTLESSGFTPTEDERRLVMLGVNLGIATCIAELRAHTLASQMTSASQRSPGRLTDSDMCDAWEAVSR